MDYKWDEVQCDFGEGVLTYRYAPESDRTKFIESGFDNYIAFYVSNNFYESLDNSQESAKRVIEWAKEYVYTEV